MWNALKRLVAVAGCGALIGAYAHGRGRCDDSRASAAQLRAQASERVHRLPTNVGDWVGTDRGGDDETVMRRAGADAFVRRDYKVSASNETVMVLLLCGKAGPLSVRTLEVCQGGFGFQPVGSAQPWAPRAAGEFTWQTFVSQVDGRPDLEIAVAWSTDGNWRSPELPRLAFGKEPFLYKLYLVRPCFHQSQPSAVMESLATSLTTALRGTVFDGVAPLPGDRMDRRPQASNPTAGNMAPSTSVVRPPR